MRLSLKLAPAVMVLCGGWAEVALASPPSAIAAPSPAPQPIFGGEPVAPCAWPTAVAVSNGGSLCTGTLVHPRVVMYAAHCGGGKPKILFGQDTSKPAKTISTELCMTYPDYKGVSDQAHDWAFCRLAKPITEIPITPIVYGCETSAVTKGTMAAVSGFGIQVQGGSAGLKNWAMTPIRQVYSMKADVGGIGEPGICPGDSGGPAFVRFPDNSWHVFGIASTLTGSCGGVGTHSLAWHAVPWIEAESGIDITPCHDQDGTWNPTFRCTDFYAGEAGVGYGEYGDWCPGTPKNPASSTCGASFDAIPDTSPPTVQIVVPVSDVHPDVTFFETPIEIDAQDGDGWGIRVVRIKINGEEQAIVDEDFPYAFSAVKFPTGSWEIVAVAEDAAGLITESEPVVVVVGMVAPPDDTGAVPTTGEEFSTGEASDAIGSTSAGPSTAGSATAGSASAGDTADMDGDVASCSCRSSSHTPAGLLLLGLLPLARRRRRDSRVA